MVCGVLFPCPDQKKGVKYCDFIYNYKNMLVYFLQKYSSTQHGLYLVITSHFRNYDNTDIININGKEVHFIQS
jgi:hypothetical protein